MHAARMLWSGLGYRGGHKPLFTPIGRELYRIVKADFREIPLQHHLWGLVAGPGNSSHPNV